MPSYDCLGTRFPFPVCIEIVKAVTAGFVLWSVLHVSEAVEDAMVRDHNVASGIIQGLQFVVLFLPISPSNEKGCSQRWILYQNLAGLKYILDTP